MGDGSTTDRLGPVAVTGDLEYTSISAGVGHTCALRATGEAYCWGANTQGQLGDGSGDDSLTPVRVSDPQ